MNRREAVSLKPFRRTGANVPLRCPLPKCRARGSWGTLPHACFSCFVLFASSKENEVAPAKPYEKNLVNWNTLRPRGPSLFRSAGKGSKRGRFARHIGSGKKETRSNLFGEPSQTRRFTSSQTYGKVRFCPTGKNLLTSHAERFSGRCLGLQEAA